MPRRRHAPGRAGHRWTHPHVQRKPAQFFYSASCGGYSESADQVWPGVEFPYLRVAADDVHQDDPPWTLTLTLEEIEQALKRAGFEGRLRNVRIGERIRRDARRGWKWRDSCPASSQASSSASPSAPSRCASTAFSIETSGDSVRFTGRGFGHGVGMCVIGAGRRAARGESVEAILAQYYPGLELTPLSGAARDRRSVRLQPNRTS